MKHPYLKSLFLSSAAILLAAGASAHDFNIPAGDLKSALDAYTKQAGVELVVSSSAIKGVKTKGVRGDIAPEEALTRILKGTGFGIYRQSTGALGIMQEQSSSEIEPMQLAQAAPARSSVETVTVTSSKLGGADVQSIPIAITALSQEQLTATQTAGGPDLIKQVPNMTFTKTNFSGYSIQLRGIGTQAISVTTDPAVAVAFNDIPFIRNHFFEQEFYDVSQVEVLRGPQGTLYGRNATAGVVNLTSALPSDQFEAMASGEIGNYHQRRFEGMINLPIVDDRLDIRVAGEWTKRQGYSFNEITDERVDGRDLWSGRVTIGLKPMEDLQMHLVWEHFSEDDDRMRTAKQLCKTAPSPSEVDGVPVSGGDGAFDQRNFLSQGCLPSSLYSSEAFEVPNGYSLPYVTAARFVGTISRNADPYVSTTQSSNLRIIDTTLNPSYKAKNDTVELNSTYALTPSLTLTSQTGYNSDFLFSTEDYNRFNTVSDIFLHPEDATPSTSYNPYSRGAITEDGYFCDPQLGCANRIVAQDLSDEHAWQLSQEFRLSSNFSGPFNFSLGGNYLHYETEENYYVFVNTLTMYTLNSSGPSLSAFGPWVPGVSDNRQCLSAYQFYGFAPLDPRIITSSPSINQCNYIDPNPIGSVNNEGHNYFLSQNPYTLNSYAGFGEANYSVTPDLKLTAGLRFTEDQKHFVDIPSELITNGWGYFQTGTVDQQWDQFTGRFVANWTPKLDFSDQSLVYASYAHGYKAGGANPPGAVLLTFGAGTTSLPQHPLTFKPEFVDAFELGTKNTFLDGSLTFNADVFYYNYENYQISEIVDRTSINLNFDAHVKGAEVEGTWEPVPGLRFNFAGGWEDTSLANGSNAIDLIDRTAGMPGWIVVKPFVTQASNCILPTYVVAAFLKSGTDVSGACSTAYNFGADPLTYLPYKESPTIVGPDAPCCDVVHIPAGYIGYDPSTAPNNGEGFSKDLSGNKLPNAPPFTVSLGAQYSLPVTSDWAATLRGDFYWQDNSWARVENDDPYDRLHGYHTLNLALILTSQSGWQVMLYDKNVFDTTAITGTFLNSDDSGLTTNVFLTDPKLIGVRVTRNW
ncbi:MAG TPA: TonB-dependent receptor [Rhizomicrobium sp.]|nr:TonB-dependent receptor [Rhizomicrobium sp.]